MSTSNTSVERPDLQEGIALGDRIAALYARISLGESEFVELVRAFDEGRWWESDRRRSCADWLSWRCGIALVTAREKVRVARALPDLPVIRDGFASGELNYSQVRDITRVGTVEDQRVLFDAATTSSGAHLTKICREIRRKRAAKKPPRAAERSVRWRPLESGLVQLDARLLPEEGLLVRNALETAARHLTPTAPALAVTEAAPSQTPEPEARALTFEAQEPTPNVEAPATEAAEATKVESEGPRRVNAQRLADSLIALSSSYLEGKNDGYFATRHVVGVTIDFETLLGLQRTDGAPGSQLLQGTPIPAEAVRRLACDGVLRRVILDARRVPLDVGRKRRTIPDKLLWALWIRDGGCRFPDCSTRIWLRGHHIVHWTEGGPTDMANLLLLCAYHHWLVHEGGYGCERGGDRVVFLDPRGRELPATGARYLEVSEAPAPGVAAGGRWKEVSHWVDEALATDARAEDHGSSAA